MCYKYIYHRGHEQVNHCGIVQNHCFCHMKQSGQSISLSFSERYHSQMMQPSLQFCRTRCAHRRCHTSSRWYIWAKYLGQRQVTHTHSCRGWKGPQEMLIPLLGFSLWVYAKANNMHSHQHTLAFSAIMRREYTFSFGCFLQWCWNIRMRPTSPKCLGDSGKAAVPSVSLKGVGLNDL